MTEWRLRMAKSSACSAAHAHTSALAASYFAKTKIVAVVGDDFAAEDEKLLSDRGIDLEGLERVRRAKHSSGPAFIRSDMNDRTTLRTDLNVFADFDPKLPESYRQSPYLMLGNIQPALQRSVRAQMNGLRLAGGDTMNYWIQRLSRRAAGHDSRNGIFC